MKPTDTQELVRRLERRFGGVPTPGVHLGSPSREDQQLHDAIRRMIDAGATRVGMRADKSDGTFSACDLAPPLARMIDHTALKPETTEAQIERLCDEAGKYCFASVCVNPAWVPVAASHLRGSSARVCTVIGFPFGATRTPVKAKEAEVALQDGATELDMVLNVGFLKSARHDEVERDIEAVVAVARRAAKPVVVKVILETSLLTDEEKVVACVLAKNAGADFVKTSTGFSSGGATAADISLMRHVVGDQMGVKASGGVRSREDAETMIAHGATRIGASASVEIIKGLQGKSAY